MNIHNKRVPCEADSPERKRLCFELFADNKARNRHYWVSHKEYAKEHNIPNEKCYCKPCKTSFSRRDFLWRHVVKRHSKESEVEEGKMVTDDIHEIVKGEDDRDEDDKCEDEEYAWVCRLKNTDK